MYEWHKSCLENSKNHFVWPGFNPVVRKFSHYGTGRAVTLSLVSKIKFLIFKFLIFVLWSFLKEKFENWKFEFEFCWRDYYAVHWASQYVTQFTVRSCSSMTDSSYAVCGLRVQNTVRIQFVVYSPLPLLQRNLAVGLALVGRPDQNPQSGPVAADFPYSPWCAKSRCVHKTSF